MRQLISYLLGFVLISTLATSSCATHKHLTQPPAPASQPTSGGRSEAPLDNVIVAREPNLFQKLLGRTPEPWVVQPIVASRPIDIGNGPAPRKCKGCTFITQTGTGNTAGVRGDAKAKGGSVVAQDKSITNALTGGGHLAAATGAGSQVVQVVPPPVPKLTAWQKFKADLANVWDAVKWPAAVVVGVFAVGAGICALAPTSAAGLWLLGLFKRKSAKPATV
jgi:hypothetical protein